MDKGACSRGWFRYITLLGQSVGSVGFETHFASQPHFFSPKPLKIVLLIGKCMIEVMWTHVGHQNAKARMNREILTIDTNKNAHLHPTLHKIC